VKVIPEMRRAY